MKNKQKQKAKNKEKEEPMQYYPFKYLKDMWINNYEKINKETGTAS